MLRAATDAELLGIEPDPIRAERARSYGLKRPDRVSKPRPHPRKSVYSDVVLFADVLEHLPNPLYSMLSCCRATP